MWHPMSCCDEVGPGVPMVSFKREPAMNVVTKVWEEDTGQDVVEYALIMALLALLVAASFPALANAIENVFTNSTNSLS